MAIYDRIHVLFRGFPSKETLSAIRSSMMGRKALCVQISYVGRRMLHHAPVWVVMLVG